MSDSSQGTWIELPMEQAAEHYGIGRRTFRQLVKAGVLTAKSALNPTCPSRNRHTIRCHASGDRADIYADFVASRPDAYDVAYFRLYKMVRSVTDSSRHPHPRHIMEASYGFLADKGLPASRATMAIIGGSSRAEVTEFLKEKFAATASGRVFLRNRNFATGPANDTLDDLRRALPKALGTAPYTCLDHHPSDTWREPPSKVIRRLLAIRHEQLRNAATLWTVHRMTSKVTGDCISNHLKAVMVLEPLLEGKDITKPDVVAGVMRTYLIDKGVLPDDSNQRRFRAYKSWLAIHNGIEGYLKTLPDPEQRKALSKFQIAVPHNTAWFTREVWDRYGGLAEETEKARKGRSDLLSNRFDEIRFIVEIRFQQISRLLSAYNQAIGWPARHDAQVGDAV